MVTLRTPPQRANQSPPPASAYPVIEDVGSESAIFKPRKPVPRTPPGGIDAVPSRSDEESVEMEIDPVEGPGTLTSSLAQVAAPSLPPTTPAQPKRSTATTTPLPPPPNSNSTNPLPLYPTLPSEPTPNIVDIPIPPPQSTSQVQSPPPPQPLPKTPRSSHKRPYEPEPEQPIDQALPLPIPTTDMQQDITNQTYGIRYKNLSQALDSALKASCSKWTTQEFKNSLPTLAKSNLGEMEKKRNESVKKMTEDIKTSALYFLEHYKVGSALKLIDEVVGEAKDWKKSNPGDESRPDAWRPDISPAALVAATNLPMYDAAYNRLRVEYLELHQDCQTRYSSILAKQAALKELEGSVSDGVIELEKTIKVLEGFPNQEMLAWTEDVAARLPGSRNQ